MNSISCKTHCTASIIKQWENDGTISTRKLWVSGAFTPNTIIRQTPSGVAYVGSLSNEGLLQTQSCNE